MLSVRDRAISIIELLAHQPEGMAMSEVAEQLGIPRTATHRLLHDLKDMGYVRQEREGGRFALTTKMVSLALGYLSASGVTDIAQPLLDRLAAATGELVRLAVVDGDDLVWVAKAQGARSGLRYDPDAGMTVYLPATANGLAWLACLGEERVLQLIARQGLQPQRTLGPTAPTTLSQVLERVEQTRRQGYGLVMEAYEQGTCAVAAAILRPRTGEPVGTVSIAGPSVRLTEARLRELAPLVQACARELGVASVGSPIFAGARAGG